MEEEQGSGSDGGRCAEEWIKWKMSRVKRTEKAEEEEEEEVIMKMIWLSLSFLLKKMEWKIPCCGSLNGLWTARDFFEVFQTC